MDTHTVATLQALLRAGRTVDAMGLLRPALIAPTTDAAALKLLARLALQVGELDAAERSLARVLAAMPGDAEALALDAAWAKYAGRADRLLASAQRALAIDPRQSLATALLGEGLRDRLRISDAIEVADRALQHSPNDWGALLARADALQFAGESASAHADAARACELSGAVSAFQQACLGLLYLDDVPGRQVMREHEQLAARITPLPVRTSRPAKSGRDGALRVGLLSPDFRRHPVGVFIEPLLAAWDRRQVVPFCYSDGAPDVHTDVLRGHCEQWRDVRGMADVAVAEQMARDGIDVLLDLAGHTHGSRPRLLATRCAPLQLSYLGYLFDPGFPTCDGVIGDWHTLPEGTASARHPLRLPGSFLCHVPAPETPPVALRGNGPVVFGSFNHLAKLSPRTVALWADVLRAVPASRLVLCALGLADAGVRERITRRFAEAGLDPARIELRPPQWDPVAFLSQYADVDIALDPLPFNGGSTTMQALWQGVPVVSCPGERMAARTSLSLLTAAGLADLAPADPAQFVVTAVRLAQDGDRRRALRAELRTRLQDARVCDARHFAAGFADLLETAMHPRSARAG